MSFGIREYHEPIKTAISNALHNQTLMFAAASNDGANQGRAFPANILASFVYTQLTETEILLHSTLRQTKKMSTLACLGRMSALTGRRERRATTMLSISCQELLWQRRLLLGLLLRFYPLSGSKNGAWVQGVICWGRG